MEFVNQSISNPDYQSIIGKRIEAENSADYIAIRKSWDAREYAKKEALKAFFLTPCAKCGNRMHRRFLKYPLVSGRWEIYCEPCEWIEIFCG